MRLLNLILVGSLAISLTAPCYGVNNPLQAISGWWNSLTPTNKFMMSAAGTLCALCCLSYLHDYKKTSDAIQAIRAENERLKAGVDAIEAENTAIEKKNLELKKIILIKTIVLAPINPEKSQEQQETETKQLSEIIASGFRISPAELNFEKAMKAIIDRQKLYLIPLLKELGINPGRDNAETRTWELASIFAFTNSQNTPDTTFTTILHYYPLPDDEFAEFFKHSRSLTRHPAEFFRQILSIIPAHLINARYVSNDEEPQILLWHCINTALTESRLEEEDDEEDTEPYLALIIQLLTMGADPLQTNSQEKTILSLLGCELGEFQQTRALKKQIKTMLNPYVKPTIDAHHKAIQDARVLPATLSTLCFEYLYNPRAEQVHELLVSSDNETEIMRQLSRVVKDGIPLSISNSMVNERDTNGATPLMYAAYNGQKKVINELLRRGADIEMCCNRGAHVLMYAIAGIEINRSDADTVQLLLAHGADTTIVDNDGDTALDYAEELSDDEENSQKIIALLSKPRISAEQSERTLNY